MTAQTDISIDSSEVRAELLARLGLPADASNRDVETIHQAAAALAEHAPESQRAWALEHLADVEAVQSLLAETPDAVPVIAAAPRTGARRWLPWAAAAAVLVAGGAFGIHLMSGSAVPGITGAPDTSSAASPSAVAIDQAKVGALMQKITANPKDAAAYNELTGLYFQAGDYKDAQIFATKLTQLQPKNATAWLALGAAQFNQGDAASAEKSWLKTVALDPKNAEVHYDLGFLYMSGSNPDMAKVKSEWEKVIAIDPTSELAKNVKTHLGSLASQSPNPAASK